MNGGSIARFSRPHQEGVLEGTSVHKQLGATARGLSIARALDVPAHPKRPSGVVDRDQGSSEIPAPYGRQPLSGVLASRHSETAGAVDVKLETGVRMRQRERGHRFMGSAGLAGRRSEKFAACRRVEEQPSNRNSSTSL